MLISFMMLLASCRTLIWLGCPLLMVAAGASVVETFPETDYSYFSSSSEPPPGSLLDFRQAGEEDEDERRDVMMGDEGGRDDTGPEELGLNNMSKDYSSSSLLETSNDSYVSRDDSLLLNETDGDEGGTGAGNGSSGFRVKYPVLRDSLSVVIPVTLIYALILLIGLVGNVSTCVVIAKNNYMHTATNYYLFSLAVSDLLLLISGLPQEMYLIWLKWPYIFGEAFCLIRGLAAETSANATVLTITAFTVERYVAICHPLRSHKLSQLSRVVRGVLLIWVSALALALPQAAQFGVVDEEQEGHVVIEGAWCAIKRELIPYAFQISICVFFVIPMTIITALYVLIGLKLRRSRGPRSGNNHELTVEPRNTNRHSQSHVIRMLVAVVVAFFICWAPFHIQRLMAIYSDYLGIASSASLRTLYKVINYVSGILYYVSTCINPILYHIMSNKFRQAFKDTMGQLFGRPTARVQHRTYSSISHQRSSRMGIHHHLHHQNHYGSRRGEHQETCINCRHTPTMCSCRGNSQKYVRTYNLDQTNGSDTTTVSLLSTSPSDKDPVIALASLDTSKGPRRKTTTPTKSQQPTGLRALLSRRGRSRSHQFTETPDTAATSGSSLIYQCETESFVPNKNSTTATRVMMKKNKNKESPGESLNNSVNNIMNPTSILKSSSGRLGMSSLAKNNNSGLIQVGPPLNKGKATKMMLILTKSKGTKKKGIIKTPNLDPNLPDFVGDQGAPIGAGAGAGLGLGLGPGAGAGGGGVKVSSQGAKENSKVAFRGGGRPIPVTTSVPLGSRGKEGRIGSQGSMDSNNTNTISNSSLQDLDESEYTGEELAGVLAELNDSMTQTQSSKII